MFKKLFPFTIDSTMLSGMGCPSKFVFQHFYHLKKAGFEGESTHLVAGRALADAMQVAKEKFWAEGERSVDICIEAGKEKAVESYGDHYPSVPTKSLENVLAAIDQYFLMWNLQTDDLIPVKLEDEKRGIEWHFELELPFKHPVYDIPLRFVGTLDALNDWIGQVCPSDEKTAGRRSSPDAWEKRGQFAAYCFAVNELLNLDAHTMMVREGVFYKSRPAEWEQFPVEISFEMQKQWYSSMLLQVEQMLELWKKTEESEGAFLQLPKAMNTTCTEYFSKCQYWNTPCGETTANVKAFKAEWTQEVWMPTERTRVPLETLLKTLEDL